MTSSGQDKGQIQYACSEKRNRIYFLKRQYVHVREILQKKKALVKNKSPEAIL